MTQKPNKLQWAFIAVCVAFALFCVATGFDPARTIMLKIAGPGHEQWVWPATCVGLITFIFWATRKKRS